LRDVWLRVERGECFGLAGPNGAGKTTLIRLLLGLATPDEGEARLFGASPEDPELRRRVGFVPEAAELPTAASPRQLVARWRRLRGLAPAVQAQGVGALERLGLGALLDRPTGRFSKGERQRTLLALALLGEPELLILDEPTDGLDPLGRALVREVVREQCALGRTVFLNSHLLSETERVCSRVSILHRGRLVREERLSPRPVAGAGTSTLRLDVLPGPARLEAARARPVLSRSTLPGEVHRPGVGVLVEHRNDLELNRAVDVLRADGALLLELQPVRADLEAALAEEALTEDPAPIPRPGWAAEAPPPLPRPGPRPGRALTAIGRVAGEITAELRSQKVGWMFLALALVSTGLLSRAVQSNVLREVAQASRSALRQVGASQLHQLAQDSAYYTAQAVYWVLLVVGTLVVAAVAVPFLDPRRTVVLYAQPISRSDHLLGLLVGVLSLAALASVLYAALLWATLRWLGLPVSPRFLLLALPFTLAFAAQYGVLLLTTLAIRSGSMAALAGLAALVIPVTLAGSLEWGEPGDSRTLLTGLYALSPKLVELARAAGTLARDGTPPVWPLLSTALVDAALVLVVVTAARRREA
jgi:ABC-2 type transport system ATP-binding protein